MLSWAEEERLRRIEDSISALERLDDDYNWELYDDVINHLFWLRDKFLTHRTVIEAYQREIRRVARDHSVTIVADAILAEHEWEFPEMEED